MKLDLDTARHMSIEFSFYGRYYKFEDVLPPVMPYQRPHPPLWFPVRSRESVEWAAENGYNIVRGWLSGLKGTTKEHFDLYKTIFESRVSNPVGDRGPFRPATDVYSAPKP